jgi:hypothetical protein
MVCILILAACSEAPPPVRVINVVVDEVKLEPYRPNLEDSSFNVAARIDRQACAQVPEALASVLNNIIVEGNQVPELSSVFSTKRANVPQYFIDVDRVKAKNRGVPLGEMVPLSALVTTKLLSVLSVPCVTTYIGRPLSVPAPVTATAPGRR